MRRTVLSLIAGLTVLPGISAADIVYDNTTARTGAYHEILADGQASGPEDGNQVTLAGTARRVTGISVVMRILGPGACSFKSTVRLYANDGTSGQPGTKLWESVPTFGAIDAGTDLTYSFDVPGVLVPDTLTWTIQLSDRQVFFAPMGIPTFNPPGTGAAAPGVWRHSGDAWQNASFNEAPFGARIVAVPAPSMVGIAWVASVLAARRRPGFPRARTSWA